MAKQYIVGFSQSDIEDVLLAVVYAENEEHALDKYARSIGIREEDFIQYVYDRSVTVSLAENFWLREGYEQEAYDSTGEVMIDDEGFKQRVKEFFGTNTDYTDQYLAYYYSDREPGDVTFPDDMLTYIWFEAEWSEVLVVPLQDLPVIE